MQFYFEVFWYYVLIEENFVVLGSRGELVIDCKLWWSGLVWFFNKDVWFLDIIIRVFFEIQVEVKVIKEFFVRVEVMNDLLDEILVEFILIKVMRVSVWIV